MGNSIGIDGTVSFSPSSGGPVTLTTGALTVSGTLTGIDSFVANGPFTWEGDMLSGPFTIDAYGGMALTTYSNNYIDGVTLNNHGTATWTGTGPSAAPMVPRSTTWPGPPSTPRPMRSSSGIPRSPAQPRSSTTPAPSSAPATLERLISRSLSTTPVP